MRLACIDVGTNTTRLLVADCQDGRLVEVHQEREFTRIGKEMSGGGTIGEAKIAEVVRVVGAQLASARAHGAREVRGVATAAIRSAANGGALIAAIADAWGLAVETLSSEREARLAFAGAAGTLDQAPLGELGLILRALEPHPPLPLGGIVTFLQFLEHVQRKVELIGVDHLYDAVRYRLVDQTAGNAHAGLA